MLQFDVNIARFLESNDIGEYAGTGNWGIYAGVEPEKPDNCITVFDIGGKPLNDLVQYTGCFFRVHIRVRGNDNNAVMLKCTEIYNLLKFNTLANANGFIYKNIVAITNIMPGGRDKNNRVLKSMNFHGLYNNQ